MADPRKTLAPIKKLLLTKDVDSIKQGVELLRSLDDPSLFDELLGGVRWGCETSKPGAAPKLGELFIGGFCRGANTTGRWDLVVALSLLAAAPPESKVAAEIIASAKSLSVDRGGDYRQHYSIDLEPLTALVNLESLEVKGTAAPTHLSALTKLPKLRTLTLFGAFDDVAELSGSASLEKLTVNSTTLVSPGVLRDVPSLRELVLSGCYQLTTLDLLRELDGLQRLHISLHAHHGDLTPLSKLRQLRVLQIDNASGSFTSVECIASCTELEELTLARCHSITTLAPLKGLRKLRRLNLEGASKLERLDLDGITSLTSFSASWTPLKDFDCLADCRLEHAHFEMLNHLESLAGLRGMTTLREIRSNSAELRSLRGIEGCADLEFLSLRSAKKLSSLAGLEHAKKLTKIYLVECESLTSIAELAACENLTSFIVEGGAYSDLTPLSKMQSLEWLSLRGCSKVTDLTPIASLPKLRAVVLTGTGVDRSAVPQRLKHMSSFAQDADLAKLAAKPPPEPRGPVIPTAIAADHRKAWTQIKKLLLTRDPEMIDQGVELVRALGDVSIFSELLKGVSWVAPDRMHHHGQIKLEGTWFEDTEPARPFRVRAVLALAAAAPSDCEPANAFKSSLKMLSFNGGADPKRACPFDVAPLEAFHALERLEIITTMALTNAATLSKLTRLTDLWFRSVGSWSGVDFGAMTSLRAVTLNGANLEELATLRDAPALVSASLANLRGEGTINLDGASKLVSFKVSSASDLTAISLRDCAALTDVELHWLGKLETVDLRGCEALVHLYISSNQKLREVRGLGELYALKNITAPYTSTAWLPTEPLTKLQRLQGIDLSGTDLAELSRVTNFPSLVALNVSSSAGLKDVSALASMKSLRSLTLQWSGVTDLMVLEGLALHTLAIKGTKVPADRVPLALRRFVK